MLFVTSLVLGGKIYSNFLGGGIDQSDRVGNLSNKGLILGGSDWVPYLLGLKSGAVKHVVANSYPAGNDGKQRVVLNRASRHVLSSLCPSLAGNCWKFVGGIGVFD